jgi:hypothetical protein
MLILLAGHISRLGRKATLLRSESHNISGNAPLFQRTLKERL